MSAPIVWSEAAQALFTLSQPTAVAAGAGSGKTTCLVELCVRLISGEAMPTPCDPGEIVAITFTDKAADELDERLRDAILARAHAAPAGSEEQRAWRMRLHALERMVVGTIHGFARRILREYALDAGLDPDLEVVDEETSRSWRLEASRAAVLAGVDAGRPQAQLLAGVLGVGPDGGGLADVVADLARERASVGDTEPLRPVEARPYEVLTLRATVLAAAKALVEAAGEVRTETGRRALARLAEALARVEPCDRDGPLRPEVLRYVGAVAGSLRGWRPGKSDGERAVRLKEELARACDALLPEAAQLLARAQHDELCVLVSDAEARYRARKRSARALDFDDLLVAARDLLRHSGGPLQELRRRFRALLVDEYQDVNRVQHEIFELLASDAEPGDGPVLVAVGDPKQSIYRFRGADVVVFRSVLEGFARGAGRVLRLTTNHRSSPPILDVVNTVTELCMRPGGGEPRDYELVFGNADRLVPARGGGAAPACEILEDAEKGPASERRRREARAIAARIGALVSGASGVRVTDRVDPSLGGRRPRYGDVAILFRRLTQIGEYERALREAGIPYRLARGGGFYQAPEVRDLGELLATLADPEDALGWAALLRSPFCGLGDGALFTVSRLGWTTLARRRPEEVAAAVVAADAEAASEAERLRRFLEAWHELRGARDRLDLPALLLRAFEQVDLEAAHLAAPDGERRAVNLRKAIAVASRFADAGGTASAFAAHLRAMAQEPPREPEAALEEADAVAVLSVHQAKGLEWPIVCVPDMGAAPPRETRRALRDPGGALAAAFYDASSDTHEPTRSLVAARQEAARAAAAESKRLLYVALTRARDRLVLSGEAGREGETWRAIVEAACSSRPELVVRVPFGACATFAVERHDGAARVEGSNAGAAPGAACGDGAPGSAVTPVVARPAPVGALQVAVTQLAEHARCPRRVFLARQLGGTEHEELEGPPQDDPDRATARGTLAHAMISEIDLTASPLERHAQMISAASRRGHDPRSRAVRSIAADVWRFLDSEPGRALARAAHDGALRREVPLMLRVAGEGGPSCYLVGSIDAILEDRRGVAIVDFKYAVPRPGAAQRHRLQLTAYAAAAARAYPGRRIAAHLQFLRGTCVTVDVTPTAEELRSFERDVPRWVAALASGLPPATAEELGRTERQCAAERCGFVRHCHRTSSRSLVAAG